MAADDRTRDEILVVEDEPTIADVVSRYLRRAGYRTRLAGDGEDALSAVAAQRPDLVLLDVMLPGISGLEVMRRVRAATDEPIAVILLTALGGEADRVAGLRLGADDYLVKPFAPAELVARVGAVLRRVADGDGDGNGNAAPLRFDGLSIDARGRRVHRDGEEIALTQREIDLLLFLARHPGQVFSRDQLLVAVWDRSAGADSATVTVHVRRLRTKLERDPAAPRWLQTVWGVGYRFQP